MTETKALEWLPESLTYEQYLDAWHGKFNVSLADLDKDARKVVYYARYNKERTERVTAEYQPSQRLLAALACITERQIWLVITEDWCVDSAFNLPVIVRAASVNPLIDLRILPRDQHREVMDRYLTGGARSIPKLVAFAPHGEIFTWGAKPAELIAIREQMKLAGADPKEIVKASVNWYEQGGWRLVDGELAAAIEEAICVR